MNGKSVGQHVRDSRETAGVSARKIALAAGLSVAFLSDLEAGKRNCRKATLAKLAKGLAANGIPITQKQLVELMERDRIAKLEEELAALKKRKSA